MRGVCVLVLLGVAAMGQEGAAQQAQYQETPQLHTRQSAPASAQTSSVTESGTQATATPVPQTPRQVLVEILKAKDGTALERHLPEITKKKMKEMGGSTTGMGFDIPSIFGATQVWKAQAQSTGAKVDIEEAGPVLLTIDDPKTKEKVEVTVENDDLAGDEDDIQLGFRMTKAGEEEMAHWFGPKISLHMKQEQGIWRFEEIGFSAKAPIGDPDFLDAMAKSVKKQQEQSRDNEPAFALMEVGVIEEAYKNQHGTYACSEELLNGVTNLRNQMSYTIGQLKARGYELRLSGCSGSEYTAVAIPAAGASGSAFCVDQNQKLRFATDGKAETCVERGEAVEYGHQVTGIAVDPNR